MEDWLNLIKIVKRNHKKVTIFKKRLEIFCGVWYNLKKWVIVPLGFSRLFLGVFRKNVIKISYKYRKRVAEKWITSVN